MGAYNSIKAFPTVDFPSRFPLQYKPPEHWWQLQGPTVPVPWVSARLWVAEWTEGRRGDQLECLGCVCLWFLWEAASLCVLPFSPGRHLHFDTRSHNHTISGVVVSHSTLSWIITVLYYHICVHCVSGWVSTACGGGVRWLLKMQRSNQANTVHYSVCERLGRLWLSSQHVDSWFQWFPERPLCLSCGLTPSPQNTVPHTQDITEKKYRFFTQWREQVYMWGFILA